MGFDIECIIDIHTYPGEYFCPVCRTLVYPNEALQSQCTHLYCKPCLAHVANNTRACPYDGYLVTEADSKALLEADKALAENIGKVKVRCLYHRSGCTWEGTLSESSSHCSGCAFGNSPVICNRCGIQIVHRQVHDHAQTCPGVYQAQQAAVQDPASSGSTAAAATITGDQNQAVAQSTASTSQAPNPQATAHLLPGQDPNQQATANTQAPAVAPTATPTPEQWYQQYYQQYAGYDPYHQSYQQYYPYQQQAAQQYQQVQGQYHGQVYSQPQLQAQVQTQVQTQVQPQAPVQPQPQLQLQPQSQSLQKVQTQSQAQGQGPVQGQPQPQSHVQTIAPQYQNLAQVNPQPQFPPPLQTHAQANPTPQPQPYTQLPPHPIQSQPHVQMPQYQQPHLQMQPPHVSQSNLQPNRPSQPQPSSQSQTQLQPLIQPQTQIQNYPPSYPQTHPQINQPTVPNVQQQSSHTASGVTGHQSYQPPQQMPGGAPQQQAVHPRPITGSLPMHGQIPQQPPLAHPPMSHGPIFNQQQASVPPVGQMPSIPPAHQQQFYPHAPPPGPPMQQHPGVQPIQHPLPQPPQTLSGPVQGPFGHFGQQQPMQSQLRPQGAPHVIQPAPHGYTLSKHNVALAPGIQPQQSQNYVGVPSMPTLGLQPQSFPQSSGGFGAGAHNKPLQLASNQPFGNENYASRTNIAPEISDRTAQVQGGTPTLNSGEKDIQVDLADRIDLKAAKSETGVKDESETVDETRDRSELSETLIKEAQKDGSGEPAMQQTLKEEPRGCSSGLPSVENTSGTSAMEDKDGTSFASKELPKQKDMSTGLDKDSKAASASASASGQNGSDKKDSRSAFMVKDQSQHYGNDSSSEHSRHSSYQQKFADPLLSHAQPSSGPPPRSQASGYGPTSLRPQGPEQMLPALPLNPSEHSQPPFMKQPPDAPFGGFPGPGAAASFGGGRGIFGPPPRSFELPPAAPQRPPLPGVPPGSADPRSGIMGRAPLHGPEGHFGVQDSLNPVENDGSQNQRLNRMDGNQLNTHLPGTLERGPFGRPSGIESNSRMLGPTGLDSPAFGTRDERFIPRPGDRVNPFMMEPIRPVDQAPRPLDKAPRGPNYDGLKSEPGASGPPSRFMPPPHHVGGINPGAAAAERELPVGVHEDYRGKTDPARPDFLKPDPGFGRHHMDHLTPRSPGREYFGIPPRGPRSFGEGPGSFNLPPDPVGNPFPDNRYQAFSGHLQRIEPDGPENMRFGERVAPSHHNSQLRSGNPFDQDILPGHLRRGEMLGPRNFPGHFRLGEPAGFGAFPGRGSMEELGRGFPHFPGGESFRGNYSNVPRHSEPGFRRNDGLYAGDLDPFDKSRKRKPVSMGWCRICKIDCETVEGLDIHSQSREHQRMAMDMVKSIKQQNKKKSKLSGDRAVVEGANKARNSGFEGRGNKP